MTWYDNDPKVKKVIRAREDKERDEDIKEARALDKARADSQKGKNMGDRKIVGWFYRNGKRIPIFEKSGSVDKRTGPEKSMAQEASYLNNRIKPQKSEAKLPSKEADEKSRAYKGSDIAVEKYYDTYEPSVAKYKGIVGKRDKDGNFIGRKEQKGFLNEGEADRWGVGTISEDNRRSQLRKNVKGMGKSERASRVKDIDFKTRMLDEEIKERRKAKSRAFYQDSKNGRYYKDYDSPEAMNADIEKETGNKGTSLITTEEIGPKREGRRLVASKSGKGNLRTKPAQDQARLNDAVNGLGRSGYKATAADAEYYLNKTKENKASNNSEMRRRMWGTPGVPGKEKPTLDIRGKRRSMYRLPQKKEFANVQPSESYIKYVMEEYGYNRADAIKFIKNRG